MTIIDIEFMEPIGPEHYSIGRAQPPDLHWRKQTQEARILLAQALRELHPDTSLAASIEAFLEGK